MTELVERDSDWEMKVVEVRQSIGKRHAWHDIFNKNIVEMVVGVCILWL